MVFYGQPYRHFARGAAASPAARLGLRGPRRALAPPPPQLDLRLAAAQGALPSSSPSATAATTSTAAATTIPTTASAAYCPNGIGSVATNRTQRRSVGDFFDNIGIWRGLVRGQVGSNQYYTILTLKSTYDSANFSLKCVQKWIKITHNHSQ